MIRVKLSETDMKYLGADPGVEVQPLCQTLIRSDKTPTLGRLTPDPTDPGWTLIRGSSDV